MDPPAYNQFGTKVFTFYDRATATCQYLVADQDSKRAVVIDPVLDTGAGSIGTTTADSILSTVRSNGYVVERILETRGAPPSDSRSSAWYLRTQLHEQTGVKPRVSVGKSLAGVQRLFARKYGIRDAGWDFDKEFEDREVFSIGNLQAQALTLPAQSPDHLGYVIDSNIFIGDASLTELQDLARVDSMDDATHKRWTSIQRLLGMPAAMKIYSSRADRTLSAGGKPCQTVEELRGKCKLLLHNVSS